MRSLPKNVLIVDNDKDRCVRLAVLINRFGYNVFVARTGPEFDRMVNGIIPHVVIINIRMPFVDNKSYLEKLRENKFLDVVNAVTLSDADDVELLESTIKKGADSYIIEPVSPTKLFALLEKLTENRPRTTPRLKIILRVDVATEKIHGTAFATSLSESGLFIRTSKALEPKSRFQMKLELPGSKALELDGEVAYVVKPDTERLVEPGMGVRFVELSEEVQSKLRGFVEDQLKISVSPKTIT